MRAHAVVKDKRLFVAICDSSIVLDWASSCFAWLTCLRVIVWSGVCSTSLILLWAACQCAFLHFVSTARGSCVKCVSQKHILHKSSRSISQDARFYESWSGFKMGESVQRLCPLPPEFGKRVQCSSAKRCSHSPRGQLFIVLALQWYQGVSVCTPRSDALSNAQHNNMEERSWADIVQVNTRSITVQKTARTRFIRFLCFPNLS